MPPNDIRVCLSLKDHRKLKRLIRVIGIGAMHHLVMLWLATAEHCPDGHLKGWDEQDIADAAQWTDDPQRLVDALTRPDCMWIEKNGDGYTLHDWQQHQPWVIGASARSEHARKAAQIKYKRRASSEHPRSILGASPNNNMEHNKDARSILGASSEQVGQLPPLLGASSELARSTAPSPSPSPIPVPPPFLQTTLPAIPSLDLIIKSLDKRTLARFQQLFEKLVVAYPKKPPPEEARAVFFSLMKSGRITEQSLDAVVIPSISKWLASDQWTEQGGRFISNLFKFLEGEMWDKVPQPTGRSMPGNESVNAIDEYMQELENKAKGEQHGT